MPSAAIMPRRSSGLVSTRASTTFAPPVQGVQLNGSLWGVRFGARLKF
jgi:hypothetical protein